MAVRTLVGIAQARTAPPAARIAASTALLDRGWGKAAQVIDTPDGKPLQLVERRIIYTTGDAATAEQVIEHVASDAARDVTPPAPDTSEDTSPIAQQDGSPTTIDSGGATAPDEDEDWREALTTKKAQDNAGAKQRVKRSRATPPKKRGRKPKAVESREK